MKPEAVVDAILRAFLTHEAQKKLSPLVERAKRIYQSVCGRCAQCCAMSDNMELHKYEGARIAYLLRQRQGLSSVRKHIQYRKNPFNYFTTYMFSKFSACPFLEGVNCAIYDDRPLVCRLFPIFHKAFTDPFNGLKIQLPSFHIHHIAGAPCDAPTDDLLETMVEMDRLQHFGYYEIIQEIISSRACDFAHLFTRKAEKQESERFMNPKTQGILHILDAGNVFYNNIAISYGAILGIPVGPKTEIWKLGLRPLKGKDARHLATKESWSLAEKTAEQTIEKTCRDIRQSTERND